MNQRNSEQFFYLLRFGYLLIFSVLCCAYRLSNAEQALENLHYYQSTYRTEEPCLTSLELQASRLPSVTSDKFEDAQKEVELVMVYIFYVDYSA